MESKLSSAEAFVEGGVQDACDDACSICLEPFCDSDPAAVTRCKHDYHLQCILEWCQRSSQCPMCWQPISMKDPMSQELLEVVENERKIHDNRSHVGALFRHPVLGDFEVPVGADDAELEERIIQHLAAAMRRSHRDDRRDGHRKRTGADGNPRILVFSTNEVAPGGSMHASAGQEEDNVQSPAIVFARRFPGLAATEQMRPVGALQLNLGHSDQDAPNLSMYGGRSISRTSENQPAHANQDGAGPSDSQSFSDTLRSHLQSASMKYKDSITKSTRGWRERWFSRSNTMSDLGSEVRREVNAGFAAVARMMEWPEATDGTRGPSASSDANNQRVVTPSHAAVNDASSAVCASGSGSR